MVDRQTILRASRALFYALTMINMHVELGRAGRGRQAPGGRRDADAGRRVAGVAVEAPHGAVARADDEPPPDPSYFCVSGPLVSPGVTVAAVDSDDD